MNHVGFKAGNWLYSITSHCSGQTGVERAAEIAPTNGLFLNLSNLVLFFLSRIFIHVCVAGSGAREGK